MRIFWSFFLKTLRCILDQPLKGFPYLVLEHFFFFFFNKKLVTFSIKYCICSLCNNIWRIFYTYLSFDHQQKNKIWIYHWAQVSAKRKSFLTLNWFCQSMKYINIQVPYVFKVWLCEKTFKILMIFVHWFSFYSTDINFAVKTGTNRTSSL